MKDRLAESPLEQAEEILLQRRNKTKTKGSQTKKTGCRNPCDSL